MLGVVWSARQTVGVSRERRWKDFDGDMTLQLGIASAIHLAHAPGPKGGKDFVRAKACAGVEGQTAAIKYTSRAAVPTGLLLSDAVVETFRSFHTRISVSTPRRLAHERLHRGSLFGGWHDLQAKHDCSLHRRNRHTGRGKLPPNLKVQIAL